MDTPKPDPHLDFDALLTDINSAEERKIEQERRDNEVDRYLQRVINELNVPRVVDFNQEVESELQQQYLNECIEYIRANEVTEEILEEFKDPETLDVLISQLGEQRLHARLTEENMILSVSKILITSDIADKQAGDLDANESSTKAKKKFMAKLIVVKGIPVNDPWIAFVDKVVPGDSLDINAEEDSAYLIAAMENAANGERKEKAVGNFFESAVAMLYDNESADFDYDSANVIVEISSAVQSAYVQNITNSATVRRAKWEEVMYEMAREAGLGKSETDVLVRYYEVALERLATELEL